MKALQAQFPDVQEDEEQPIRRFNFPKPISEPPSPTSTRPSSPTASSQQASDNEQDNDDDNSHDSEEEERELKEAVENMGI